MPSAIRSVVQEALALQNVDPGIDADEEGGEERQEHRHHQHRLRPARRARDAVGDRIADQQQDRRRKRGDAEAAEIRLEIDRVGNEDLVALERQSRHEVLQALPACGEVQHRRIRRLGDHGLRQADLEHDQARHQEQHRKPERGDEDDQSLPPADSGAHPGVAARRRDGGCVRHRVSSTQASGLKLSQTRSFAATGAALRSRLTTAAFISMPLSSHIL